MATELQLIETASPLQNLEAYIHWVNRIPMLTEQSEKELSNQLHTQNDVTAAKQMVMAHLRFVVKIARGYVGYGLPFADLIQEGNIGLMKAVKRFDPNVGVRLVSFAVHWVRAEIHEFILRNWRIVKIATTKAQRKLFYNLRNAKKHLGWLTNEEAESVAQELGVSTEQVRIMESRLSAHDVAFDGHPDDDEDSTFAPAQYLEDHRYDPAQALENSDWQEQRESMLQEAFSQLDERSQIILRERWLNDEKATLHDLAKRFNVSAERIRQLESNAMKKLKGEMETEA